MPRSSSETAEVDPPTSGQQSRARMVARLLENSPEPLVNGEVALRVVETRGRGSGRARYTPLGVLRWGRSEWLVSPDSTRDWVRNLLAWPRCACMAGSEYRPRRAVPMGPTEAAPVVVAYLAAVSVPWARDAFPVSAQTPHAEIAAQMATMAVFRLDPARTPPETSDIEPLEDGHG